jgi:hypothetical protein
MGKRKRNRGGRKRNKKGPRSAKRQQAALGKQRGWGQYPRDAPFLYPRARGLSRKTLGRIHDSVCQLPFFAGPRNPDIGWRVFGTLMQYEEWVARGTEPGEIDWDSLPTEFDFMLHMWPETFEYFRHAMREYMDRVWSEGGWFLVLRSLVERARHEDPPGYSELRKTIDAEPERMVRQTKNARRAQRRSDQTENMLEWIEQMLEWHRKFFEIDSVLWLLGVLGEFARSGEVKPGLFGGPTTDTPQGALVNEVRARLAGTPLENLFELTYDTPLRNAVTHNDYELIIDEEDGTVGLVDHDSARTFTQEELHDLYYASMSLEQAMLFAHNYIENASDDFHVQEYRDLGFTDATYNFDEDGSLTIVLYQLWCFYEQDSAGSWLDTATLTFHRDGDRDHVTISEHSCIAGMSIIKALATKERALPDWARVIRLPVAPDLDLGYQKLYRETGHYEVLGPGDSHIVRVVQLEGEPHSPCPYRR